MQTVLIVDDEPLARQRLVKLLAGVDGYRCIGEAAHGEEALMHLRQCPADIVLLDIRMPGMDGIAAAQQMLLEGLNPAVIFCTAYNDYAMQAFEANAVGYLLKPVNVEKLQIALAKAQQLRSLESGLYAAQPQASLTIKSQRGLFTVPMSDIVYCLSDNKYTSVFYWQSGELSESIYDGTLKQLEQDYPEHWLRVHRNALVAKASLTGIERHQGQYYACIKQLPRGPLISRRHVSNIKQFLAI